MGEVVPLPGVDVPEPSAPAPCEWCGREPAERYETEPAIYEFTFGKGGVKKRSIKKAAVMAWACKSHRDRFDAQKAELAEKRRQERARKRAFR